MARISASSKMWQTWSLTCMAVMAVLPLVSSAPNANTTYSPARPPAIPLAVRSPYLSAWSTTADGGTLNSKNPIFYNGAELGWEGLILVDGVAYEYLGTGAQELPERGHTISATQTHVEYDSQWSNFTFTAGPLEVIAHFFSPVIPQDTCRTSVPLSYMLTSFRSQDGEEHDVKLYSDIQGPSWLDPAGKAPVRDAHYNACSGCVPGEDPVSIWVVRLAKEITFGEVDDRAQWGNLTYASSTGSASSGSTSSWFPTSGRSADLRARFLNLRTQSQKSTEVVDPDPAYAFVHTFANATSGIAQYTIGFSQDPIIQYLTASGLARLEPWWKQCHGTDYNLVDMVEDHYREFPKVSALGRMMEDQLRSDILEYYSRSDVHDPSVSDTTQQGTGLSEEFAPEARDYYAIVALSARQVMGANVLTSPPDSAGSFLIDPTKPWMWQKEISSNGNMNTVDVIYPAMPFFLYANPEMLAYLLTPLYAFQYSGFYPNGWSIHDLGARFPNATGHVAGDDEPMPVEESANMLIMSLAYAQFTDQQQAMAHGLYLYDIWKQWAEYLVKYSLIPESQLSTDDFAGTLHNQTNLAIKGIVALEAMNVISRVLNKTEWLNAHNSTPQEYIKKWQQLAIEPGTEHTSLTYQLRSSWGLLYNTYPDLLLGLNIVPKNVSAMQCEWYRKVSQEFGVPLDNRHGYTKSDWEMWTAATCDPETRSMFVNAMAHWINTTLTGLPMSDLYETTGTGGHPESPASIQFKARPSVGGHYSLLALLMMKKAEEAAADGSGRVFPRVKYMDLA